MFAAILRPAGSFTYYKWLLSKLEEKQLKILSKIKLEDIASFLLDKGWTPSSIKNKCRFSSFHKEYKGTIIIKLENGVSSPPSDINRSGCACLCGYVSFKKKDFCKVGGTIKYIEDCDDEDADSFEETTEDDVLQKVRIIMEIGDNSLPGMSFEEVLDKIISFKKENRYTKK